MSERAEILFKSLQSRTAINALINRAEDADFDCKEWHGIDAMKDSIAKAACGFANATGGVIVIGMSTRKSGKNQPDVVTGERPVSDVGAASSEVLDIILKHVRPGVTGVQVHTVRKPARQKSGFVLVYIPEQDGPPQRSTITKEFYVRVASGTLPMEYFQIEDRFGRRPHARLIVELKDEGIGGKVMAGGILERRIAVILGNKGGGLARFASVRFRRGGGITFPGVMDAQQPIWPYSYADKEWISIRGGSNDVVYPGETLRIATIVQEHAIVPSTGRGTHTWEFPAITITTEAVCDGTVAHQQSFKMDRKDG
jgi:hypothetical protein